MHSCEKIFLSISENHLQNVLQPTQKLHYGAIFLPAIPETWRMAGMFWHYSVQQFCLFIFLIISYCILGRRIKSICRGALNLKFLFCSPLSPVKVDAAAPDDRPGLVDVVDLDDAVQVPDPPRAPPGPQASAAQQVQVQEAAQSEAAVLRDDLGFVLDEVWRRELKFQRAG